MAQTKIEQNQNDVEAQQLREQIDDIMSNTKFIQPEYIDKMSTLGASKKVTSMDDLKDPCTQIPILVNRIVDDVLLESDSFIDYAQPFRDDRTRARDLCEWKEKAYEYLTTRTLDDIAQTWHPLRRANMVDAICGTNRSKYVAIALEQKGRKLEETAEYKANREKLRLALEKSSNLVEKEVERKLNRKQRKCKQSLEMLLLKMVDMVKLPPKVWQTPAYIGGLHPKHFEQSIKDDFAQLAAFSNLDLRNTFKHQANFLRDFFSIHVGEDSREKMAAFTDCLNNIKADGIGVSVTHNIDYAKFMKLFLVLALAVASVVVIKNKQYYLGTLMTVLAGTITFEKEVKECLDWFMDKTLNQAQADTDFEPLLQLFFVAMGVGKLSTGKMKDFMSIATGYRRAVDGTKNMFSDILGIVESIVNYVRVKALGLDKIKLLNNLSEEMEEWVKNIDETELLMEKGLYEIDCLNHDRLIILKTIGDRMFKEVALCGSDFSKIRAMLILYNRKLADLMAPFRKASLDASHIRAPPLSILIRGESGVGKSAVTVPLIDSILARILPDESSLRKFMRNNMDFIYPRTFETKFWDGYNNQLVTVFDDFMQNVEDLSNQDGEPMNIIRAMNPFPYQLHMAHLEDKGSKYFSSKIIVATTNDYNLRSITIKKPEALERRMTVQMDVYPKLEYCIDPTVAHWKDRRLRKDIPDFTTDVYEFQLDVNGTGVSAKRIMNYDECIEFLVAAYHRTQSTGNAYVKKVADMRTEMIEARIAKMKMDEEFKSVDGHVLKETGTRCKADDEPHCYAATSSNVETQTDLNPSNCGKTFSFVSPDGVEYKYDNVVGLREKCHVDTIRSLAQPQSGQIDRKFWENHNVIPKKDPSFKPTFRKLKKDYKYSGGTTRPQAGDFFDSEPSLYGADRDEFHGLFGCRYEDHLAWVHDSPQSGNFCMCKKRCVSFLAREDLFDVAQSDCVQQTIAEHLNDGEVCECYEFETIVKLMCEMKKNEVVQHSPVKRFFQDLMSSARKTIENWPILAGFLGIVASLKVAHSVYTWFSPIDKGSEPQYGETRAMSRQVKKLSDYKITHSATSQAGGNHLERLETFILSICSKNVYVAFTPFDDEPWGIVTAIKGDIFMMSAHYYDVGKRKLDQMGHFDMFLVPYKNAVKGDLMTVAHHVNFSNLVKQYKPSSSMSIHDFWLFRVNNIRPHKDIVKRFITEEELGEYKSTIPAATIFLRRDDDDNNLMHVHTAKASLSTTTITQPCWNVSRYLYYPYPSENGDCGSLSVLTDPGQNNIRLVGFHSGILQGSQALSTLLTQELLTAELEIFSEASKAVVLPEGIDPDFNFDGNGLTVLEPPAKLHRPMESKIEKSPLFGLHGDPTRIPAVLKQSGDLDPYELAIARYGTGNHDVDDDILKASSDNYLTRILSTCKGPREVLTFNQAVAGVPGRRYIDSLCRSTSPGYPWNQGVSGGKWDYFGRDQVFDLNTEKARKLYTRCHEIIEAAKDGRRLTHYYIDALKDELRPLAKVAKVSTRMISCCPMDLIVVMRMYFGCFVECFMVNRIFNGSTVGINPCSPEWTMLVKHLRSRGFNIVAGDFGAFDATQATAVLRAIGEIIISWYNDGEENARIRRILWQEVVNSLHLHGDKVVMMDHSLPSGMALTVIVNTIYVNVVLRMCWILEFNDTSAIFDFDKHVVVVANGDDHAMGISDEAIEFFNYQTICKHMSTLGLTYTAEDKTIPTYKSKEIEECTFLKRGFRLENGMFTAPLDLQVILELPYWLKKGPAMDDKLEERVSNCLRELSQHDVHTWDVYSPVIFKACRDHGIKVEIGTRAQYHDLNKIHWRLFTGDYTGSKMHDSECLEMTTPELMHVLPNGREMTFTNFSEVYTSDYLEQQDRQSRIFSQKLIAAKQSGNVGSERLSENLSGVEAGIESHDDRTVFLSDAPIRTYEPAEINDIPQNLLAIPRVSVQDNVKCFLARPTFVGSFVFDPTNAPNDTIYSSDIPQANFYGASTDIFLSKLEGFAGMRATAVFKFVLAVERFAQGRLLIHYIPGEYDVDHEKQHTYNLQMKTQQPRIEVNINRDTMVEIKVPYVSPSTHYNLQTREGIWGRIFCSVYSPLVGLSSGINVNVFVSFEDVDLVIPTFGSPQGGSLENEKKTSLAVNLRRAKKIATDASKIPLLSSIATPTSWFLAAAENCASALGWTAAYNSDGLQRIADYMNPYHLTCDGQRNSLPMGMSCDNEVDVLPGFAGNNLDEMAIKFFATRPAYITNFTIGTSDIVGGLAFNQLVTPANFRTVIANHGTGALAGAVYSSTPVGYLMNIMRYWRGSLVYSFKFVKTEFHTGKIEISYQPYRLSPVTYANTVYCPRHIVDIKDTDEFHVTIPYMQLTPWTDGAVITGELCVNIVSPLNCPTSVSSTISVIVEVAAGDDFAVACPKNVTTMPMTFDVTPQSGLFSDDCRIKRFVIGDTEQKPLNLDAERYCVGEAIRSVKQLASRFTRTIGIATAAGVGVNYSVVEIKPMTIGGSKWDGTNMIHNPLSGTFYDAFACCYALSRGSVYIEVRGSGVGPESAALFVDDRGLTHPPASTSTFTAGVSATKSNTVNFPLTSNTSIKGTTTFHVPTWSTALSRYNLPDNTNGTRLPDAFEPNMILSLYSPVAALGNTNRLKIYKSAGDDCQFGFFIGVPLMFLFGTFQVPVNPDFIG